MGEVHDLTTRGAGLAAPLPYGKDRARPEGAEAGCGVMGVGANDGRATEEGELGGARAGGAERGAKETPHPPALAWVLCNPAPPSPPCRESVPHPSVSGSPSGTAAKGRAGPSAAVRLGMLLLRPGKTPCPFLVISPECWLALPTFSGGGLAPRDPSLPVLVGAGAKKIR